MGDVMFKETLKRYKNRHYNDRLLHNIMVLGAGPGTGKSRVNMEAVEMMKSAAKRFLVDVQDEERKQAEELLELLNCAVSINLTYGNGSSIESVDTDDGKFSLGRRIIHQYFVGKRVILNQFDSWLEGNLPTISEALNVVKEHKQRELGDRNKLVLIYVGIDEYNKYNEGSRQQFKQMFNTVGGLMCHTPKDIFFQPLFTGIDNRDVVIFTNSMHRYVFLEPSLLEFKNLCLIVESLVESTAENASFLKDWHLSRDFKRMMADTGGHPRTFEVLLTQSVELCKRVQKTITSALLPTQHHQPSIRLWDSVVTQISLSYPKQGFHVSQLEECMIDSVLERPISILGETATNKYKVLYELGMIMLSQRADGFYVITVPLIWFHVFKRDISFQTSQLLLDVTQLLSPSVDSNLAFEKFVINFNLLMNNIRVARGIHQITLGELIRGGIFQNEEMKQWTIKLQPMSFCSSSYQYKGNSLEVIDIETDKPIDWENGEYFVHNAPGAPFANFFNVFQLSNFQGRIVHLGQVKRRSALAKTANPTLTIQKIEKEHLKATQDDENPKVFLDSFQDYVFVMYTMQTFQKTDFDKLPKNTVIIDYSNFSKYFGSILSTRAELEYFATQHCYPNQASFTDLMAVNN